MRALASALTATKVSDWVPVAAAKDLGIGDVVVIEKRLSPCKPGTEDFREWDRRRYAQTQRKPVTVRVTGRIVRRGIEPSGPLRGLFLMFEPTALSAMPGETLPSDIRIKPFYEFALHERHVPGYKPLRSTRLSPAPAADERQRLAFMGALLEKACSGDLSKLARFVDPWDIPCREIGFQDAKRLLTPDGWPSIRELHIRQADGRVPYPRAWSSNWQPKRRSEPFDHRLIPDDGGRPQPPTPPRRIRTPEELELDRQRRAQLIAEAEADPAVAALLAAIPGAWVREVRLRGDPDDDDLTTVDNDAPVKVEPVRLIEPSELVDLDQESSQGSEYAEAPPEKDEQEHGEQMER